MEIVIGIYKVNYYVNNIVTSMKLSQSSEIYIELSQTSMLELFCENNEQLKTVNHFQK